MPAEVEYKDGDSTRRVALDKLLESTGTHAFIVIKDGKLLDERYFERLPARLDLHLAFGREVVHLGAGRHRHRRGLHQER